MIKKLKKWADAVKTQIYAVYLAYTQHKIPWYAKLMALLVIAYALSPIDLIPDFIPIFGLLDDLILLPLGIALVVKLIPKDVWEDCTRKAQKEKLPKNYFAAAVIILIWIGILTLIIVKIIEQIID